MMGLLPFKPPFSSHLAPCPSLQALGKCSFGLHWSVQCSSPALLPLLVEESDSNGVECLWREDTSHSRANSRHRPQSSSTPLLCSSEEGCLRSEIYNVYISLHWRKIHVCYLFEHFLANFYSPFYKCNGILLLDIMVWTGTTVKMLEKTIRLFISWASVWMHMETWEKKNKKQ